MWMLGQKSHCDCINLFILSEGGTEAVKNSSLSQN